MKQSKFVVVVLASFTGAPLLPTLASAATIDGGTALNPAGSPRIGRIYTYHGKLIVTWNNNQGYTHFNVRWNHMGGDEHQFEADNNFGAIKNYHSGQQYHIRVQGCTRGIMGSDCSAWSERYVTPD